MRRWASPRGYCGFLVWHSLMHICRSHAAWLARQVLCSLAPVPAVQALAWLRPPAASGGRHTPLGQPTAADYGLARRSLSMAASAGQTGGGGGILEAPGAVAAGGAAAGDMLAATQARWDPAQQWSFRKHDQYHAQHI